VREASVGRDDQRAAGMANRPRQRSRAGRRSDRARRRDPEPDRGQCAHRRQVRSGSTKHRRRAFRQAPDASFEVIPNDWCKRANRPEQACALWNDVVRLAALQFGHANDSRLERIRRATDERLKSGDDVASCERRRSPHMEAEKKRPSRTMRSPPPSPSSAGRNTKCMPCAIRVSQFRNFSYAGTYGLNGPARN
jgi:hypothetical protein